MDAATRIFCPAASIAAFLLITGLLFLKINQTQPNPYMDEVFHVPQAQRYCAGNFSEWDPMITTLPGLYLISVGILKPFFFYSSNETLCSTFALRSVNYLFAAGNLLLLFLLSRSLNAQNKALVTPQAWATAFTLSLFPVLYFFTFLFYTDSGSTFFVLLMYLFHKHQRHTSAAVAGTAAVLFRQTNIIWVVFMAGLSVVEILQSFSGIKNPDKDSIQVLKSVATRFLNCIRHQRDTLSPFITKFLVQVLPYAVIVLGFVVFIFVNGSIVVGAKQDHQAGLHLPQVFYFSAFLGAFSFVHIITFSSISSFLRLAKQHPFFLAIIVSVCVVIVSNFTMAHRYLLADNRHYTFYIWARIFQRHPLVKFMLIPGYMFSIWVAWRAVDKSSLWKAVYCVCVVANLIPATLIEFRYFMLPYLIYRLNLSNVTFFRLVIELFLYAFINCLTIYLFINRPFFWDNNPELQRFMW